MISSGLISCLNYQNFVGVTKFHFHLIYARQQADLRRYANRKLKSVLI